MINHQKNVLNAHFNFAFAGWITQALMTCMIDRLCYAKNENYFLKYRLLLRANLVTAYGMLISFLSGIHILSSAFSFLSIVTFYVFALVYWKDLNRARNITVSHYWFKAALVFGMLSSFGIFTITANPGKTNWYLASLYYYLHFQYNGWFFFACMGLLVSYLSLDIKDLPPQKTVFWLFALACIPAYFLSALWLPIANWMYVLVVLSAMAQMAGWVLWVKAILKNPSLSLEKIAVRYRWILFLSAVAFSIKLLLQSGSTIPALSKLAFGFRPIVIGYLHLVLLGIISLFLLSYAGVNRLLLYNRLTVAGTITFIAGIIYNELFLMIQGIAAISYQSIPYTNELLLSAAFVMFTGVLLLNAGQIKRIVT